VPGRGAKRVSKSIARIGLNDFDIGPRAYRHAELRGQHSIHLTAINRPARSRAAQLACQGRADFENRALGDIP